MAAKHPEEVPRYASTKTHLDDESHRFVGLIREVSGGTTGLVHERGRFVDPAVIVDPTERAVAQDRLDRLFEQGWRREISRR